MSFANLYQGVCLAAAKSEGRTKLVNNMTDKAIKKLLLIIGVAIIIIVGSLITFSYYNLEQEREINASTE